MASAALLAVSLAAPALAQIRVPLDGEWQVRRDDEPQGWRAIQVPSAFETVLGTTFDGVAVYRRSLPLPAAKALRTRVEFAAVATHTTVLCNGTRVAEHLGGWTPFAADLTAALRHDGTDQLEVRVDEKVGHNTQGFLPIIQPHFGGIWQGVTLCLDQGPVLDRLAAFTFGRLQPDAAGGFAGDLRFRFAALTDAASDLRLALEVSAADRNLATADLAITDAVAGTLAVPGIAPWSPGSPQLYTVRAVLHRGAQELDRIERRVGFRSLAADGTRVLWNGSPLQVRGVLHWGYSPPHLAPPVDPAWWRAQLVQFRSHGFNLLKCCLWVPPRCVFELADELGMLVWQEYPTWHPQMDQAHKQELLAEYREFFALDRNHASVAFRSITCETGHGADLDVVQSLFAACKEAVPDTLVVDDSSWFGWQRVTDFWDEHPYGNNSWFPGRLADFQAHLRSAGEKPILLGECIAADTWVDRAAWQAAHGDGAPWWRPDCWPAQAAAEAWLVAQTDASTLASLRPQSLDFAMRNRKFQIEQLRLHLPHAGYVVSVARDFAKARMGLVDDLDRPKWQPRDWAWHGDTMLCLDAGWDERSVGALANTRHVRIAHFGAAPLTGELVLHFGGPERPRAIPVQLAPGTLSAPFPIAIPVQHLARVRLFAELTGSHPATNHWDLWTIPSPPEVTWTVIDRLTPQALDQLEAGNNLMLVAGPQAGSPRTEAMWSLRGAPFAANYAGSDILPPDLLLELSSFDLESGRVLPWAAWQDQVDPILGFWETHDIPEVRWHLLAGTTRVGKGRLLLTSLRLTDEYPPQSPFTRPQNPARARVGALFQELLGRHEPKRALSAATIARLRGQLTAKTIDLPTWRFRTDPDDQGRAGNWQDPAVDAAAAPWRELRAGSHWENQGEDLKHYTGVAWYRVDVEVAADWQGLAARAVFEGVDDSFHCWLNGELVGSFGDAATRTTIWLERQVAELGTLRSGRNTLVLRVVDHAGAGGLWKPVFLTTGPAEKASPLLH
ncbi:MAG: sugar-binding domain-containing protein [Planctomycetota bacterium]